MNVVILAAGMGKRMQSALPKVLHPLAGKPLLQHVIDTARRLTLSKLCVIYGHGGAAVPDMLAGQTVDGQLPIDTALQQPQLGTGHAVMQAVPQLDENVPTLVLYGDVPLTTEASLRRLVEAAGLTHRVDFDLQVTARSDDGVRRPDLVVRLPEGKCIAVDAKVPLAAFIEASEIPAGATGAEAARRDALLQDHVKAVRAHIDALSAKGYWTDLDSPEFVVAFLPSEALLSAALAADPALLDYSFGKRVALASPVNLWAVLKTVAYTWNQQRLTDDAHRLFKLSETLYTRFGTLADRAESLRTSLERTVRAYNEFAGTLENRVLVTARQLKSLDEGRILGQAKPVETTPRMLTAAELAEPEPEEVPA